MMKTFVSWILLALSLSVAPLSAQSVRRMLINADYTFYSENFEKAITLYQAVLDRRPENDKAKYHQMIAQYLTTKRSEDVTPLIDFFKSANSGDRFFHYWMGRIYYVKYEFALAKQHFQKFLSLDSFKSKEIISETRQFIKRIEQAEKYYSNPTAFKVEPLGGPINSEHPELSPVAFNQQNAMVFASSRPEKGVKKSENEFLVFHSTRKEVGWSEPVALANLGTLHPTTTTVEVVDEEGKMYVYKEKGRGDLFYSIPSANGWSSPKEARTEVRSNVLESDFFINESEDHLIFAVLKGYQIDLYESRKKQGVWSKPRPLRGVNSKWDEDSPFLSQDGKTLYFSSNRPGSMGGFDIFKSTWDERRKRWLAPENLGFPINTIDDEVNFQFNRDNMSGFLSSNRLHSLGDFDIYYFRQGGKAIVKGTVMDFDDHPMGNVSVTFRSLANPDDVLTTTTNKMGKYEIELPEDQSYIVEATKEGKVLYKSNCRTILPKLMRVLENNLIVQTNVETAENEEPAATTVEEAVVARPEDNRLFTANISNIYFDEHTTEVPNDSEFIIHMMVRLLNHHPDMKIVIHGHADRFEDNKEQLAIDRAESVKKVLVDRDIAAERIEVAGYGDTELLATADDEMDGRELNRRIEVSIVE